MGRPIDSITPTPPSVPPVNDPKSQEADKGKEKDTTQKDTSSDKPKEEKVVTSETTPAPAATPTPPPEQPSSPTPPLTPATPAATPTAAASPAGPPAENDSYSKLFPEPSVVVGNPPSWILWVILLVASAIVGVVGYQLLNNKLNGWLSVNDKGQSTPTASPSASASLTATSPSTSASQSPTPSATPSASATPSSTPSPSAAPTVNKAGVTLRVLNGTTVSGAASAVKTELEKAGFSVRTIGNAKDQTYATGVIYYQTGKQAEAQAVKQAITSHTFSLEESSTTANPDNVLVVIGQK